MTNSDTSSFHNLVVVDMNGTIINYYIKYTPDAIWAQTHTMAKDMASYTGTITFYDKYGIPNGLFSFVDGTFDEDNSDDTLENPCDPVLPPDPDDDGSTTGGGGNGNGNGNGDSGSGYVIPDLGGSSGGGDTSTCTITMGMECTGGGHHTSPDAPGCTVHDGWSITFNIPCGPQANRNGNIYGRENTEDPCGGDVGILIPDYLEFIEQIEECLGIDIGNITYNQADEMHDYLITQNQCSEEAKDFAEAILDAGTDAKVDYLNEVILDSTFFANEKIKCTYDKISQNATIKNLLENFTGQDNANILILKVQEDVFCNNNQVEACTRSNLGANNTITTTFDEDYILSNQTPTLFIAQTIIHEAIHANMYLALYNHEQGNLINLPAIDNFPAIYEQYRLLKGWQHEFMAAHYIALIAQTLQDIHPLLNDQTFIDELNNDYPDLSLAQFYTSIAYLGLNGTVAQSTYLTDPNNNANYNISYYAAQANSTKTPNCN